ncbi:acetoacetate--CoA ligase [Bacillus sp. FJAT-42315]|uniref:acetoacetate--CoA ligase n=1 Tax=Bacillus sp. FJAT-42315 TaxID=2014077 RepID=UPI000C23593A|nr:acetoacetate--CoA ligase [Bacillus sp. FJAT-42315]
MKAMVEGEIIWEPSMQRKESTVLSQYVKWLNETKGLNFSEYTELWRWSVDELENFWQSIWEFCEVKGGQTAHQVLNTRRMPGNKWFEGANLSYTENVFSNDQEDKTAIYFRSEHIPPVQISWKELRNKVAAVAHSLKKMGVKRGDRIVSYMPNIPETVIAFLATASIGAIWSSCSPDFGARSVIDRFQQIEPVVLFAVDGYQYNGKVFDKTSVVSQLQKEIVSLKHTIVVPYVQKMDMEGVTLWSELFTEEPELSFEKVSFDHPLWIVYSSGTTGIPKPIVQGHGGIVLEHMKLMKLQYDLTDEDIVFWFTTTGWVMWNLLVASLLAGSSIAIYDGSPSYPSLDVLWEMTDEIGISFFGTSAPFINNSMKAGVKPKEKFKLSKLKSIASTGAPLTGDGYQWVYEQVKNDVWLSSSSGGTDVCTGFVGGVSTSPVRVGEIQGPSLGVHVEAYDDEGRSLINQVGELVISKPMPSMPLYFWNDLENKRYFESYFDTYPGIWKHGDWIKIDDKGSSIIYGRSDSTINRSGVRAGTSDIYRVVERLDEVMDSLVIDLEVINRTASLLLFVALKPNIELDSVLTKKIKEQVKLHVSPRFIPDHIYKVDKIPKTLNGKKLEVPIRKMLLGFDFDKVINPDSMSNPESLPFFKELAQALNSHSSKGDLF